MSQKTYPKFYLYSRIVQAKLYIDQHFTDPIALRQIAGEASFSRYHFLRLFKNAYGKTPHQYMLSLRLEKAKQLLQQGLSVTDVCHHSGFESLGSFSSLFKRASGYSPTQYQSMHQQAMAAVQSTPLRFIPGCFAAAMGWKK